MNFANIRLIYSYFLHISLSLTRKIYIQLNFQNGFHLRGKSVAHRFVLVCCYFSSEFYIEFRKFLYKPDT